MVPVEKNIRLPVGYHAMVAVSIINPKPDGIKSELPLIVLLDPATGNMSLSTTKALAAGLRESLVIRK